MRVFTTGNGPAHQAPFSNGHIAQILVDQHSPKGQMSAAYVTIPAGGSMPEHAHGESTALVILLTGQVLIRSVQHEEIVTPGQIILLDRGEQVSMLNEAS